MYQHNSKDINFPHIHNKHQSILQVGTTVHVRARTPNLAEIPKQEDRRFSRHPAEKGSWQPLPGSSPYSIKLLMNSKHLRLLDPPTQKHPTHLPRITKGYLKTTVQGLRNGSALKSTGCSSRGLRFNSHHLQGVHNHIYAQCQGT